MKVSICTLGCRVNQYESDAISEGLQEKGFTLVPYGEESDVVIINTCTVTGESDRKSRQLIRRAVSAAPDAAVIVTGCFAQVSPAVYKVTYPTSKRRFMTTCESTHHGVRGLILKLKTDVKIGVHIVLFRRLEAEYARSRWSG